MLHALAFALVLVAPSTPASAAPTTNAAPVRAVAVDSTRADDDLRTTVLRNARDVRRCYEAEGLRRNAELRGTVEVEMTILPTGVVEHVDVTTVGIEGLGTRELTACIATAAHNWRFERGPFDVETVVFPFNLAPDRRDLTTVARASD